MWPVVVAIAVVLCLLVPSTRPIVFWLILVPMVLLTVRFRRRLPAGFAPERIDAADPRIAEPISPIRRSTGVQLAPLGFVEQPTFILDRGPGQPTTYMLTFANPESRALAIVATVVHHEHVSTHLEFRTRATGAELATSNALMPSLRQRPGLTAHNFPSLAQPARLWTAHQARASRIAALAGAELPADIAAEVARLISEEVDGLVAAGLIRRRRPGGPASFTWHGAAVAGLRELWPWRQRIAAAVRGQEERLLAELGLSAMLEQARAGSADAAPPAPERGVVRITDDRGQPRVVVRPDAADTDDRAADPRFRALVAQAASARRSMIRSGGLVSALGAVVSISVLRSVGLPFVWAWVVTMAAFLFIASYVNRRRVLPAERAAADTLLSRGLCPSCLYSLADLTAAEDGCIACPECGGAWRSARIKEFMSFAPGRAPHAEAPALVRRTMSALTVLPLNERARSKDHRGGPCQLVPPHLRHELALAGPELRPRLDAARRRIRRSGRWIRWITATIVTVLFVGPPVILGFLQGGVAFSARSAILLLMVLLGAGFALGVLRGNFAFGRKAVIRAMLQQGLCPACAADLSGLTPEPDGCTGCPCGGAWRMTAGVPKPS